MYLKTATTIDEQIRRLKDRGMQVCNEAKAQEILSDIGYYRLGFYWFPFETDYPKKTNRTHLFKKGALFEDAVALYYFDSDLRDILSHYLHRIEINFRTAVILLSSNKYRHNPTWFVDKKCVDARFIDEFPDFYMSIRKNDAIKRHHNKYQNDKYAPAWKTLEYMTLGNMLYLFGNMKDEALKVEIAGRYGYRNVGAFYPHMETVRVLRNLCAHGHNLFDYHFSKPIKSGPLRGMTSSQSNSITGGLIVTANILKAISQSRYNDFVGKVGDLVSGQNRDIVKEIVRNIQAVI